MINQCQFVYSCGLSVGHQCNSVLSSNHSFCRFHGSFEDCKRRNLTIPEWVKGIISTDEISNMTYKIFLSLYKNSCSDPSFDYEFDDIKIVENLPLETEVPTNGCRYMITMGRYQGYYCGHPNKNLREMCLFHESVCEWDNMLHKSKKLTPFWAKCIHPRKKHSKLSIVNFPWKTYNIDYLLFFDIDIQDIEKWCRRQNPTYDPTILKILSNKINKNEISPKNAMPTVPIDSVKVPPQKKNNKLEAGIQNDEYILESGTLNVYEYSTRPNHYRIAGKDIIVMECPNGIIKAIGYTDDNNNLIPLSDHDKEWCTNMGLEI